MKSYNKSQAELEAVVNGKSTDHKVDALSRALIDLLDGLVASRQQIGSVSAQVTCIYGHLMKQPQIKSNKQLYQALVRVPEDGTQRA